MIIDRMIHAYTTNHKSAISVQTSDCALRKYVDDVCTFGYNNQISASSTVNLRYIKYSIGIDLPISLGYGRNFIYLFSSQFINLYFWWMR